MRQRLRYLCCAYVLTLLLFIAAKVIFVLCCGGGHGVTLSDMTDIVCHGLTLDLSTALYLMIVPLLVCLLSVWIKVPRWILQAYHALIAFAMALAFVADTSLYPFWGFKLDGRTW